MKKGRILLWMGLLCLLAGCAAGTGQPADTTGNVKTTETAQMTETMTQPTETTTLPTETTAETLPPIDYTVFCGDYSDTETVEGPCYTVRIISVDNETKAIELEISFVGRNSSPIYVAEQICSTVTSDHTAQFEWKDSWENRGVGTLILNPDDPSTVQLLMTVTEEAEVNRATLSTHDEYKTFTRR